MQAVIPSAEDRAAAQLLIFRVKVLLTLIRDRDLKDLKFYFQKH